MTDACALAAIEVGTLSFGELVDIASRFGFHPVASSLHGDYSLTPLPWKGDRVHANDRDVFLSLAGKIPYFSDAEFGGFAYFGGDVNDTFDVQIEPTPPKALGWDLLGVRGDAASWRSDAAFVPNFLKLFLALTFSIPVCPLAVLDSRCVDPNQYFTILNRQQVVLDVDANPAVLIVDRGLSSLVMQTGTGPVSFNHRSKVIFTVEEWVNEIQCMLQIVAPQ